MLGVSGAKSFSGFMVAAPGVPRSLATPQPGSRRVAPGARGVCGSALPPASAHGPRHPGPACLAPPPRAALGNRAWNPPPTLASSHPTAHATSSRPAPAAPAMLKGQRPYFSDHMTSQQFPSSASRARPSPATPPRRPLVGWPRPREAPPFFPPSLPKSSVRPAPWGVHHLSSASPVR